MGFAQAPGDVLMILDADLTMPPEDLPKFYEALVSGKGEFINGSWLVYPVRRQHSLDIAGGLKKGEFLAHRNVHRSEDETANSIIEGAG